MTDRAALGEPHQPGLQLPDWRHSPGEEPVIIGSKVFSVSCYSQENSNHRHLETKMMLNDSILSPSLVCQVVERLCQGEGRCTVAVTSHQDHCADR